MSNENKDKQVRKNPFVGSKISSGKAEFEARLSAIDQSLASCIKGGSVHTVDAVLYASRYLGSETTIELMQSADAKKVGETNINKRQLEANTYMLVTGVQVLMADEIKSQNDVKTAKWKTIDSSIANGEFELKCGDKVLIPRNSCEIFRTPDGYDGLKGYHALECPKFLSPLTDIIPQIWLPAAATDKAVKVVFYGVRTNKA